MKSVKFVAFLVHGNAGLAALFAHKKRKRRGMVTPPFLYPWVGGRCLKRAVRGGRCVPLFESSTICHAADCAIEYCDSCYFAAATAPIPACRVMELVPL